MAAPGHLPSRLTLRSQEGCLTTAQTIVGPSPHAGTTGNNGARIHEGMSRIVVDLFGIHRTNDGDLISQGGDVGKRSLIIIPIFPVAGEWEGEPFHLEFRSLELSDLLAFGEGLGHGLPIILFQHRLVVEGFQVRGPAGHTKVDDPLNFGRIMEAFEASRPVALADLVARHKVAQSEYAKTG